MAARLHQGQFRKDRRTPYAAHPFRVAMVVRHIFGVDDEQTIAAALLHDVIEDTPADRDDIIHGCGPEVARITSSLSKDVRLPESEREDLYHQQLAESDWRVQIIKLADVYDNLCDAERGSQQSKSAARARRVLDIVSRDPHLTDAIEIVKRLIADLDAASCSV